jgi:hypothetical protein
LVLIKIIDVTWHGTNVVKKMEFGGLRLMDPSEAKNALLVKRIMHALEPSDSNLKSFFRYCLKISNPEKEASSYPIWRM